MAIENLLLGALGGESYFRALELAANLPVVPEWINDAANPPAMALTYRVDFAGSGSYCLRKHSVRVGNSQNDPHGGASTTSFWAHVAVLGRLVCQPELRSLHRETCNHVSVRVLNAIDLNRPKCELVELDRSRPAPN
jgi:hypothetical protein